MDLKIDLANGKLVYGPYFDGHLGRNILKHLKENGDNLNQIEITTGLQETNDSVRLRSIRMAESLKSRGLKLGDVVIVCAINHNDAGIPLIASQYIGTIAMTLYTEMTHVEMKHFVSKANPRIIFSDPNVAKTLKNVITELNIDAEIVVFGEDKAFTPFSDLMKPTGTEEDFKCEEFDPETTTCFIICSSGTTGIAKLSELSHKAMFIGVALPYFCKYVFMNRLDNMMQELAQIRYLNFSPLFWGSGIHSLFSACLQGIVRLQSIKPFSIELVKLGIEKYGANMTFVSSMTANLLLKHPEIHSIDFSKMGAIGIGGGIVSWDVLQKLKKLIPNGVVTNGYGSTESGLISLNGEFDNNSTGRICPWVKWKIVDLDTEKILGMNHHGEIMVKTDSLFKGYYKDSAATAASFDEEGYFKTGDIGYYDEKGHLYIVDRLKEMISYQSYHIAPGEIENIICSLPGVKFTAVVGIPHSEDGEHLMAFVELMSGANLTAQEIKDTVKNNLSDRKQLRGGVVFLEEMPLTPSSKIDRKVLRQLKLKVKGE